MLPRYDTVLFTDIWESAESFRTDIASSVFSSALSSANQTALFYLLYARYGNSPIANYDTEQFKMKVFSIIFQYGPTWEKRLDIQNKLRGLSEDELMAGSRAIYNHAYNPSTDPSTSTLEELAMINDQNTTNYKRSKLEAYAQLWDLLETDITGEFIDRFAVCFKKFVSPERTFVYIDPLYEDEEDDD